MYPYCERHLKKRLWRVVVVIALRKLGSKEVVKTVGGLRGLEAKRKIYLYLEV